jgi:hypothetical protein
VDKLVKVYLKDGQEKWILVNIEVQGYRDPHFEERMFTYYYRIKDRYQHNITAWAIFTDNNVRYHPKGSKLGLLKFTKVVDYQINNYIFLQLTALL